MTRGQMTGGCHRRYEPIERMNPQIAQSPQIQLLSQFPKVHIPEVAENENG